MVSRNNGRAVRGAATYTVVDPFTLDQDERAAIGRDRPDELTVFIRIVGHRHPVPGFRGGHDVSDLEPLVRVPLAEEVGLRLLDKSLKRSPSSEIDRAELVDRGPVSISDMRNLLSEDARYLGALGNGWWHRWHGGGYGADLCGIPDRRLLAARCDQNKRG